MSQLTPFGISVRRYESMDDAKAWAYRRRDGSFPPTPLIFPENPWSAVVKEARRILEVGSGCGRNVPWIMGNTRASYDGVEPNPAVHEFFWEYIDNPAYRNRCKLTTGLPVHDTYDVILTTFVFQHIGFRPSPPTMNVADITRALVPTLRRGGIWILFEHEVEETGWIERWQQETGVRPQVRIDNFGGFPELNDRGQLHHLMIWMKEQ